MLTHRVTRPERCDTTERASTRTDPTREQHTFVLAIDLFHPVNSMEMSAWALENVVHPGDRVVLTAVVLVPPIATFLSPDGHLLTSGEVMSALTRNEEIESQMEHLMDEFSLKLAERTSSPTTVETRVIAYPDVVSSTVGTSDTKTVVDMLDAQVAELGADACTLLVASSSHGGLAELLSGSVAAGSVRHSHADAVVVYRTGKPRANVESEDRIIVVAVDESESSVHALEWATAHLNTRDNDVFKLVHIVPSVPFLLPSTPTLGE